MTTTSYTNNFKVSTIKILLCFLFLLIFFMVGCKKVHTEIWIPAQPQQVWAVITNTQEYKNWHPLLTPIKGQLKAGSFITYSMTDDDGNTTTIKAKVTRLIPNKELHQKGGIWGVLSFDHRYTLQEVEEGTLLIQQEDYLGWYVPFWDSSSVKPNYQKVNNKIKQRVLKHQE